ncbi:juvenile hormone acid O-methyltransferase-like [Dermacentor variabilis]|uniref:juvenile hormone acid O-methyltransferase-like n=1 Tax=Dermacentor variabilis TaxID=34621 RepID=UPI003F5C68E6
MVKTNASGPFSDMRVGNPPDHSMRTRIWPQPDRSFGICIRQLSFGLTMLDHAARNHAHPKIEYLLLDIANDKAVSACAAREGLFERVCCFLTLHWISDKAAALRNLERLTAPGGECLVVFNPRVSMQQVLRAMIASGKWKRHEHALCVPLY